MKQGQDEYFALVGESMVLLKNLDEKSSRFLDDFNRLREILAMIGVSSAVEPLKFSLAEKEASVKALSDYLRTGLSVLPDELAVYEAETVAELAQLAGDRSLSGAAQEWAIYNGRKPQAHLNTTKQAAFNHLVKRGVKHGVDPKKMREAMLASVKLLTASPESNEEYVKARTAYAELVALGREQVKEAHAREREANRVYGLAKLDGKSAEEINALLVELTARGNELEKALADGNRAVAEAWERMTAITNRFNEERAAQHAALFAENGKKIIDKVIEASPITQEQADAWAAEQVIDANAKAKLKKLGYPIADVVRDMAEFYRLSGGKVSAIRIGVGGKRASAAGITERLGEKVMSLGTHFNKTVLFHELAHYLEGDPIAKAAANGFLLKRRESDAAHRLRDLTGNKGYDALEIAYKDHFMDPYVGKIYKDGITEVWAMGVQYLANPKDAVLLAAKDPEMFDLITGYLTMPTTPAMHAKLNMHKSAIGELQEKKQTEEAVYERAVAFLSAKAKLAQDNWFDSLAEDDETRRLLESYILYKVKKDRAVYVGSHGPYRVFSGVFRNRATKRASKGHVIVDIRTDQQEDGSFRRNIPDHEIVHGGIDIVQASIALAERDGTGLFRAIANYFVDSWGRESRKKNLIETVGVENLQ